MGPKTKGLRFRASWSDQSIIRLLDLILASPEWRLAIYALFNGSDAKAKDMWKVYRAIQCEFYQNDLVWRDCMVKDKLVRVERERWVPTTNWTSATYDPVEAKLRVLKEKREEIQSECKLNSQWTEFAQVPKPQQKALKIAYPYFFHLQRLYLNKAPGDPVLPLQTKSSRTRSPVAPRSKTTIKAPPVTKTPEPRNPVPQPVKTVLPEIIDLTSSPDTPPSSRARPTLESPVLPNPTLSSKRREVSKATSGSAVQQTRPPAQPLPVSSSSASSTSSDDLNFARPNIRGSGRARTRDTASRVIMAMSGGQDQDDTPLTPSAEAGPSSRPMITRPQVDLVLKRKRPVDGRDIERDPRSSSTKDTLRSVSPPATRVRQRTPEEIVRRRTLIQTGAIIPAIATGRQIPPRPRRPPSKASGASPTVQKVSSSLATRSRAPVERFLLPEESDTEDSSSSASSRITRRRSSSIAENPDTPPVDGKLSGDHPPSPDPSTAHSSATLPPARPDTPPLDPPGEKRMSTKDSSSSSRGETSFGPDPTVLSPRATPQQSTPSRLPNRMSAQPDEQMVTGDQERHSRRPLRPLTPPSNEPNRSSFAHGARDERVVPIDDLLERARSNYFHPTWLNDMEYRDFQRLQDLPTAEREHGERVIFNRAEARMLVEAYERIARFEYRPSLLADVRILIPFEMNDETKNRAIYLFKSFGAVVCHTVWELARGHRRETRYVLQSTFETQQHWERRDSATGYWIESATVLSLLRKVDWRHGRDDER